MNQLSSRGNSPVTNAGAPGHATSSASTAPSFDTPAPTGLLPSLFKLILLVLPIAVGISYLGRWAQTGERDLLFKELIGSESRLPYAYRYTGGTALASEQRWLRLTPSPESPAEADGKPLPKVVLIGRFAAAMAAQRQFESAGLPTGEALAMQVEAWNKEPKSGFDGLIDRGTIAFGPYETDYVQIKRFRPGDEPFELLRINLTRGATGQLLEAHFAPGASPVDPNTLLPFLSALELPAPTAAPAPVTAEK